MRSIARLVLVVLANLVAQSLGRSLAGNAPFATVNLVNPGDIQGDRINQLDLRVGKTCNQSFIANGSWLTPTLILPARFAKITGRVDFQTPEKK